MALAVRAADRAVPADELRWLIAAVVFVAVGLTPLFTDDASRAVVGFVFGPAVVTGVVLLAIQSISVVMSVCGLGATQTWFGRGVRVVEWGLALLTGVWITGWLLAMWTNMLLDGAWMVGFEPTFVGR